MSAPVFIIPGTPFPAINWWVALLSHQITLPFSAGSVTPDQSINRYAIATANGPMILSIPLKGGRKCKIPLEERLIDYTHNWQRQHWGAIFSAYGRAPFFEHFGPELEALIFSNHVLLQEFSLSGINWLCRGFRINADVVESPAPPAVLKGASAAREFRPYHQVFEERWGFLPNLSAIDLLMNEGPHGVFYLR